MTTYTDPTTGHRLSPHTHDLEDVDNRKPAPGKSTIARRTRRLPQPLDWAENEARYQESQASHADDANEHRNENH